MLLERESMIALYDVFEVSTSAHLTFHTIFIDNAIKLSIKPIK